MKILDDRLAMIEEVIMLTSHKFTTQKKKKLK